jgi:hypothetical protein
LLDVKNNPKFLLKDKTFSTKGTNAYQDCKLWKLLEGIPDTIVSTGCLFKQQKT